MPYLLFVAAFFFIALAPGARAQSLFGGSITWTQTGPMTVQFEVVRTMRKSLFPANTAVGSVINNNWTLNFGDGSSAPMSLTVIAMDPARDKLVARGTLGKSYLNFGTYTAFTTTCCRPNTLAGSNGLRDMRLAAVVPLVANPPGGLRRAPRLRMEEMPLGNILYGSTSTPFSFQLPVIDPDLDTVGYRFSTPLESSLFTAFPAGAAIDPQTGVLTLPAQASPVMHAMQITMDDGEGTSCVDLHLEFTPHSSPPLAFTLPAGESVESSIGVPVEFQVVASNSATGPADAVSIFNGPLPTGLTLLSSTPSGPFGNTVTLNFRWIPVIDSPDESNIRFTALTENNEMAVAQLTLRVLPASVIYLSGVIRDFKSSHADFDLPDADANTRFVQTALGTAPERQPVFLPAPGLTSTTAATFPQWWLTDPDPPEPPLDPYNRQKVHNMTLSNAGQANPRVFRGQFGPYPIDNELFGNEGQPHNGFFTYEIQTYITPQPGDSLSFKSSDDLWVFIDGRLVVDLGGIHAPESATINLQTLTDVDGQPLNLVAGQTYNFDLYYAHRGQHAPDLVIDLVSVDPLAQCSDLAAPSPLTPESFQTGGPAELLGDGSLELIEAGDPAGVSSAAWLATPVPVSQGIWLSFDYEMSTDLPGFALVFADPDTPPATLGAAGAQMGYGGIPGSVAIEFDQMRDIALGDPVFVTLPDHFAIHSRGVQPNSAGVDGVITSYLQETEALEYGGDVPFGSNAVHHVDLRIFFLGRDHALVQFYFDRPQPITHLTVPTFMQVIPAAAFAQAAGDPAGQLHGALKLGFTSATLNTGTGPSSKLQIRNVKLGTRQLGGSRLEGTLPFNLTAGQEWAQNFQLTGECGTPLVVPGRAADFTATFTRQGSGETVPVSVTDLGNGDYALDFIPTLSGQWSLAVSFAGEAATGSPYTYTVISPYAAWAAATFNAAIPAAQRDPEDDPDHDGIANGLEYLTGGDPDTAGPSPFTLTETATELILSYPLKRSVAPGSDPAEISDDLDDWLPATGLLREVEEIDANTDLIKLHLPIVAGSRKFLRVAFAGEGL